MNVTISNLARSSRLIGNGVRLVLAAFTSGDHTALAQYIDSFGQFQGPVIKVLQFLSTETFMLPPDVITKCRQYYDAVKPLPPHEVSDYLECRHPGFVSHFTSFNYQAIAAASLGQVHQASLPDGRQVACKIQYPKVSDTYKWDVAVLANCTSAILGLYKIDIRNLKTVMSRMIDRELDYLQEQQQQNQFRVLLSPFGIGVPLTYPELSSQRILVTEFIEGVKIDSDYIFGKAGGSWGSRSGTACPPNACPLFVKAILTVFFAPIVKCGIMYPDLQPGNLLVDRNGKVWLLDFGMTLTVSKQFVSAITDFFKSGECNYTDLGLEYSETGDLETFKGLITNYLDPFFHNRVTSFNAQYSSHIRRRARELTIKAKNIQRSVSIGEELFFAIRGIKFLMMTISEIGVSANYYQLLRDVLATIDNQP